MTEKNRLNGHIILVLVLVGQRLCLMYKGTPEIQLKAKL